jgi:putative colanic acid biosynthesis acetyltransferase WcaF
MNLSRYDNSHYHPGAGTLRRAAWYVFNALVFDSWVMPVSAVKRPLLRLFGARIGRGVVIKPRVNIKNPWRLSIGDHCWVGEGVWIDNVADVRIGSNVCLSQGAYLVTGNHDYRDDAFRLVTGDITIEDGVWVAAFAVVCPGVTIRSGCVLSVRCVATADTEPGWVYQGSPAVKVRPRHAQRMKLAG